MKLEKILENLNSLEKNSFLKVIDNILSNRPKRIIDVEKILSETSKDLKSIDSLNISKVFSLLEEEFEQCISTEFLNSTSQLDILIDIISRDGNAIMKYDWFGQLYEKELKTLNLKLKNFSKILEGESSEYSEERLRDLKIYKNCLYTAYFNDVELNQDPKIIRDEQTVLNTLSQNLGLSQDEVKLINYLIVPIKKLDVDTLISELKSLGVIFFSRKLNTLFVADEIVNILRKIRGKEVSNKYFRRVLKALKEPQLNLICKNHNIDRKLTRDEKIKVILNDGIPLSGVLGSFIFKEGTKLTEKKKFLNDFFEKELKINPPIKGITLEEKIQNLILYFDKLEKDEKVGISIHGYTKLLSDLYETLPKSNDILKNEFELQEQNVLNCELLLDYNIKPKEVLELISFNDLKLFCEQRQVKTRGDIIENILSVYTDTENLFLENYEEIGFRNLNALKANGIVIKEADLGLKFEELTKTIFTQLGFNVNEELRNKLNSNKDKVDIIISLENEEVIVIECKTIKESGFNKFSQVSRQLKGYANSVNSQGFKVIKSILIAPEFSDDFIKECGLEYELNLSLIKASSLLNILKGFKESKLKKFPFNLLMRDVLIQEERVIKAISK